MKCPYLSITRTMEVYKFYCSLYGKDACPEQCQICDFNEHSPQILIDAKELQE